MLLGLLFSVGAIGCEPAAQAAGGPAAAAPDLWPPALSSHVMVYHDSVEAVLVFGGSTPDRTMSDTLWSWDGERWRVGSIGGPPPRIHAAVAYDVYRNRLVVYGGIGADASTLGDLWEWDGTAWEERTVDGPSPGPRDHGAMVYSPRAGGALLFGGQDAEDAYPTDTWLWDGERWQEIAIYSPTPGARGTHRLAYDPRGSVLLFGGWGPAGQRADVWTLAGDQWTHFPSERESNTGPTPRGAHRYAFDEARGDLVVFGGLSGETLMADTWTRTRLPVGWEPRDVPGPPARNVHGMAYDRHRERVVLYGGIGEDGRRNDLWEWDGRRWFWRGPPG